MDKQTFLTMSPSKREQEVNKLLQDHDLKKISDLLGIPSSNSDEVTFFKQREDTLKKVIQHFENKGLLFLDERIYSRDSIYSNKSIRMNNAIYEEFSSFYEKPTCHCSSNG